MINENTMRRSTLKILIITLILILMLNSLETTCSRSSPRAHPAMINENTMRRSTLDNDKTNVFRVRYIILI